MVLSLNVSNLFFCMTASDSHGFAHGDAPNKIEILRHELETLNQLVPVRVCVLVVCEDDVLRKTES